MHTTRIRSIAYVLLVLALGTLGVVAFAQGSNGSGHSSGSSAAGSSSGAQAGTAPNPNPSGNVIALAQAFFNGEMQQVLATPQGLTLYYSTDDTADTSNCSGSCLNDWKPYTVGSGTPTGPSNSTLFMSTLSGPNGGSQLAISGHPLYTYAKDQHVGDANGAGTGASWHVATPWIVNETY